MICDRLNPKRYKVEHFFHTGSSETKRPNSEKMQRICIACGLQFQNGTQLLERHLHSEQREIAGC
jgi:hypothetical protein